LGLPILPGIILDSALAGVLHRDAVGKDIAALLDACGGIVGKRLGDRERPLLFKIVVSPNLAVSGYPVLLNVGLVKPVIDGFAARAGNDAAAMAAMENIRGMLLVRERIRELEGKEGEREQFAAVLNALGRMPGGELDAAGEYMGMAAGYFPDGYFEDAETQVLSALEEVSTLIALEDQGGDDTAMMVQVMAYGNGGDSVSGECFSRNPLTGEKGLQGRFFRGGADEDDAGGQSLDRLEAVHLNALVKIAGTLEDTFKEIRRMRFVVEEGRLWLVEQGPADRKSVQADITLFLELAQRGVVDKAWVIKAIDPLRLNEILHPVIDPAGVDGLKRWTGGIAGAPGAAVGKAYFSSAALLEARKQALRGREDARFILVLESSFAEDVKAIEVSAGVLTVEGGYAAHASVVARQYGKASLVAPGLKIQGKAAVLGDFSFSQGEYVTLDVPCYGPPSVYLGAAGLVEPDPGESGLLDFIALTRGFIKDFHVRANAETPGDAALALALGAEGIGLCRTEHMFFGPDRINVFREMLFSDSLEDRREALDRLLVMQREDFYAILKVMAGRDVTIRLLDAPLHEFLPHSAEELDDFVRHMEQAKGRKVSKAGIMARFEALEEFNPMLGRRGCRIAVSYPEIYAMQVRAMFEAVYRLKEENAAVCLEIMVPLVMSAAELQLIAYGKRIEGAGYAGIADVEEALRSEKKASPVPYAIGAMIELPAAALGAGEIARYGRFFSFGTNDLTQTALGISRDDFTAFMPDYTLFDLIPGDPFSALESRVKELIVLAVERGRLTRPDLVCGLCGEHGANPANVRFCMDAGLNYVSCSPYSTPIALLAVAQAELERAEEGGKSRTLVRPPWLRPYGPPPPPSTGVPPP
jgi:pyruvate,orthophosphate dikinase